MYALLAVLGLPLAGAAVLALVGHRDAAPEINAGFSLASFVASAVLTARIIAGGPVLVLHQQFFIDPLNVFLVARTAFVAFRTSLFARPYIRIERDHGKMTAPRMRLFHGMYQLFTFTMLLADDQQHGAGRDGGGHARHRVAGRRLPHARQPRGRVEILHPVRRGHRAGAVRHDPALSRRGARDRSRRRRAVVDQPGPGEDPAGADRDRAGLRVPAGRLRHQGRTGAAAQLAARRARAGSDPDFRGPFRPAAERRAVRGAALQGAGRRRARLALLRRRPDDGLRPAVGRAGGVLPVAPARYQAHVRVFVDPAHGARQVRLRHRRADRELRPGCCT